MREREREREREKSEKREELRDGACRSQQEGNNSLTNPLFTGLAPI